MLPLLGCMIEVCQGPDSKCSDQRRVPLLSTVNGFIYKCSSLSYLNILAHEIAFIA